MDIHWADLAEQQELLEALHRRMLDDVMFAHTMQTVFGPIDVFGQVKGLIRTLEAVADQKIAAS